MRYFFLIIGLLIAISIGHGADAAPVPPPSQETRQPVERATRVAQNGHRDRRGERGSVVEGCGVRDALCVANRLLRQMERQTTGQRRRQIDELGKLMQRACGKNPKDVVCTGEFVSQGLALVTGPDAAPEPIIRERRRPPVARTPNVLPPFGGLTCRAVRGYTGLFPTRASDNRSFGSQGFTRANGGCAFAIANWSPRFEIACVNHSTAIIPQNMRDGYTYGAGMRTLRDCVKAVSRITNGQICVSEKGRRGFRVMNIPRRSVGGPTFLSFNQCLDALDRRRR